MNYTKIGNDIKVGSGQNPITLVDLPDDKVYVANSDDNTVSVINSTTDTKIENDIKVGLDPVAIAADLPDDKVYVANSDDNNVSG